MRRNTHRRQSTGHVVVTTAQLNQCSGGRSGRCELLGQGFRERAGEVECREHTDRMPSERVDDDEVRDAVPRHALGCHLE